MSLAEFHNADSISLDLPDKALKESFCKELSQIISTHYPNIESTIEALRDQGLPVFMVGYQFHLRALMLLADVDTGFISPHVEQFGQLVETLKKYFPEQAEMDFSQGIILLNNNTNNMLFLMMAMYHWQACNKGLPGYSKEACKLYRIYSKKHKGELPPQFINNLELEELISLKATLKRQDESIRFLKDMVDSVLVPINNAKRLAEGKAQA